mgnify:CR=1 FL=1
MKRKYVQAMMTGMTAMLAVTVPVTTVAAATPEKEQTVYVNADQNGNVEKVIVSNWLKNTDKESTLEDNSELNDITNVKGEESYTQGSTANGTWLHLWEDVGGTSQMWELCPTPEGTVRLRSSWAGGKCVDTVGMGAEAGAVLQIWQERAEK